MLFLEVISEVYMNAFNARVSKDKLGNLKSTCKAFSCVLSLQSSGASFNRMRIREVYNVNNAVSVGVCMTTALKSI